MKEARQFGGFDLYEKIGTGGMATVYRGVQRSLDRQVVLKILHPHLSEDEHLIVRFEREARAAANLRHENIVQVIDCGRQDATSYIAMEYVEGMDLKRLMETYGPPPLEMAALILRDVCRGLEHAHRHRIIHRDVKPANLMLTPEGMIKIMDFGLARRGEDSVGMTATGAVLGTPAYMSPEQAMGEHVDERSDIFSVGVVGYEMFGGRRPFPGDSYASVMNAILTLDPEPLAQVNPTVPAEIAAVIHRMIQKDVSARYPSITAARDDLETIIEKMGLVRSRDLLRRYAGAPAQVTETLNGLRGASATLDASRPGAELLTRADFKPQETLILSPGSTNGGEASGSLSGAAALRTATPVSAATSAPPASWTRTPTPPPASSRAGASADLTIAESVVDDIPERLSSGSGAASRGIGRPAARRDLFDNTATRPPFRLSRAAAIGIGGGVLVMALLVLAVFKFAGPGEVPETPKKITEPADNAPPPRDAGGVGAGDAMAVDDQQNHAGLSPPRESDLGQPGLGPSSTDLPDAQKLREQVQQKVDAGLKTNQKALETARQIRPPVVVEKAPTVPTRRYTISSRPWAEIYVDGHKITDWPAELDLKVGTHTFRARNDAGVDVTVHYDVRADDPNNTLVINTETRAIEARNNPSLPY